LELVRNPEDASTFEGTDVEKLSRSLALKEEELLESKRECADLKLTNVHLLNRAEVSEQKSWESAKVEEELLASEDSREKLAADLAS
jgi:phage pi2 protein 07